MQIFFWKNLPEARNMDLDDFSQDSWLTWKLWLGFLWCWSLAYIPITGPSMQKAQAYEVKYYYYSWIRVERTEEQKG